MSANNYRECPCCRQARNRRAEVALKKAHGRYAAVPAQKYHELLERAHDIANESLGETLREDYQILPIIWSDAVQGPSFYVSYRALCERCGWSHRFTHEEKIDIDPK